jgi:hypothetical protein
MSIQFDLLLEYSLIHIFSSLTSNETAWRETKGMVGINPDVNLSNILSWGAASTKGASTCLKVSPEGFATVVEVKTGLKYWVTGQLKHPDDLGTANAFGKRWHSSNASANTWKYEGVLLGPGTVL